MKQLFILGYILLISGQIFSQKIVKTKALEDIIFLNKAVTNGHPVNYDSSNSKITLDKVVQKLQNIEKDSIEMTEFRLLLNESIYEIGCIHTQISNERTKETKAENLYFPLILVLQNGKLLDTLNNEIWSINGISTPTLIRDFEYYYPSDGATSALSTEVFNQNSSWIISRYFKFSNEYEIKSNKESLVLKGVKELPKSQAPVSNRKSDIIFKNAGNYFYSSANIPILKISSFCKSDKSFYRKAFGYLRKKNSEYLILDLRGNLGGNRKSTVLLTKHLVSNSFNYSILQPKLNIKKYLNVKGKIFLALSKLKYNIGDFFQGRRTKLGREFVYKFKPKRHCFKGQIFVLTDGYTASASTMVTSWLKQHTKATFIGKQSGGGYNGNNGGSFPTITLPNSKYEMTFPAYRLILDKNSSHKAGIVPDLIIEPKMGSDNVLIQTIQLINSKK